MGQQDGEKEQFSFFPGGSSLSRAGDMGSGPGRGPKSRTMLTARPQKSKGLLGLSQAELSLNSRTEAPTPSTSDVTVFRDGPLKEVIKIK